MMRLDTDEVVDSSMPGVGGPNSGRSACLRAGLLAAFRVKLEDRLATVTSAREGADSAAVARELDCEHALDHLDTTLQVRIAMEACLSDAALPAEDSCLHMNKQ